MWWSAVLAHRSKFLCRRRGAFYMRPPCRWQGAAGGYGIRPYGFVFDHREKTPHSLLFLIYYFFISDALRQPMLPFISR